MGRFGQEGHTLATSSRACSQEGHEPVRGGGEVCASLLRIRQRVGPSRSEEVEGGGRTFLKALVRGRSLSLTVALNRDPSAPDVAALVCRYAAEVWAALLDPAAVELQQQCGLPELNAAYRAVRGRPPATWGAVRGPLGATWCVLRGTQWTWPNAFVLHTPGTSKFRSPSTLRPCCVCCCLRHGKAR